MLNILIFILIGYSISNIIVFSSIFSKIRDFFTDKDPNFLGKLVTCMMCTPFWVGVIGSYLVFSPTLQCGMVYEGVDVLGLFTIPQNVISIFLDGCLISGTTWLIHTLQEHLESK